MTKLSRPQILETTRDMVAYHGAEGVSIRNVSDQLGVAPSVLYHYFSDKDELFHEMFDYSRKKLGLERKKLNDKKPFEKLLEDRILFQFEHAKDVTAILKYYFTNRSAFSKNPHGYVPVTAYTHIKEVLEIGIKRGEIADQDLDETAKVLTHAINGFVLEYFPHELEKKDQKRIAKTLVQLFMNGIGKGVSI